MRIAEIYGSLQGEGLLAGTPSTFVRSSGCNLRCRWCDTPFTSWEPVGREMPARGIVSAVESLGRRHVVLTGGEPLLFEDTVELCRLLRQRGHHVTIETAGTVLPASYPVADVADLMSISPKLSSSAPAADTPAGWASRHASARRRDDVLRAIMAAAPWQFKFVIDGPADLDEAIAWLSDLGLDPDSGPIFMMPQGITSEALAFTAAWLRGVCNRAGFRLAQRHHIEWFGYARGT